MTPYYPPFPFPFPSLSPGHTPSPSHLIDETSLALTKHTLRLPPPNQSFLTVTVMQAFYRPFYFSTH